MEVVWKDVKHVRISVHPPEGRVRVSAPRHVSDRALAQLLAGRMQWIRRKQAEVLAASPAPEPEFVTGERHFFGGRECRLLVTEAPGRAHVRMIGADVLALRIPPGTDAPGRGKALERWYRRELDQSIGRLLQQWTPRLGVSPADVRIRRMKTRWGSCNTTSGRIWLNLELAKRSSACLEYVLVHELVHLLEGSHSRRFWSLMDGFLPSWREHRKALRGPC